MSKILDIEKIGEKGKLEISHLKLILKEILEEIKQEAEKNKEVEVDISTVSAVLFAKGVISKEEYSELKDKVSSIVGNNELIEEAIKENELSDEVKAEIIRKSFFKGFYKTYEALVEAYPPDRCKHGFFAYIKDFEAGRLNANRVAEYIFDINYGKWMSATDETLLRNFRPRFEKDVNRNEEPLDGDILVYNNIVKRWFSVNFEEGDVARLSDFRDHVADQIHIEKDDETINKEARKNDGRMMVLSDPRLTPGTDKQPRHIDFECIKKLINQADEDYYKTVSIGTEVDELGVERILPAGDYIDKYGNPIQRNITNQALKVIIDKMYENLDRTFDIKLDEHSKRMLELKLGTPKENITRTIKTVDVDKIIKRINEDYNNSFIEDDYDKKTYEEIINRFITDKTISTPPHEIEGILKRLVGIHKDEEYWHLKEGTPDYARFKNVSTEVMEKVFDFLNFLNVAKDILRDEIFERDNIFNGNKTLTGNFKLSSSTGINTSMAKLNEFLNVMGETIIKNCKFTLDNDTGESYINHRIFSLSSEIGKTLINHFDIEITNPNATVDFKNKTTTFSNENGEVFCKGTARFLGDTHILGNLYIGDSSKLVEVEAEKVIYKDNILELNNGEKGAGVSYGKSGFLIDRGKEDNYFFGFDEIRDEFVAGTIKDESDSEIAKLNPLLHRANVDELEDLKCLIWSKEGDKAITSDNVSIDVKGAINFSVCQKDHALSIMDVVRLKRNKIVPATCNSLEEAEAIGVIYKIIDKDNFLVVTSGIIPCSLKGVKVGAQLYLQPNGKIGIDSSHLISKTIGYQLKDEILINIQRTAQTNNTYTSYQKSSGLKKFDAVIMGKNGELEKASSENIETTDVLGVVSKLTTNSVQIVTAGFIEGDIPAGLGETLFLQHDGSLNTSKNCNVEKAIGTKVALGMYVDIKLGVKKVDINKQSINKNVELRKNNLIEINSIETFEIGELISFKNGKYVKFQETVEEIVGIVTKVLTDETSKLKKYLISTSNFIHYDEISLSKFSNTYSLDFKVGNNLYYGKKFNTHSGTYLIGAFLDNGFYLIKDKIKTETISDTPQQIKTSTVELLKDKYYKFSINKLSMEDIEIYQADASSNYCKLCFVNNSQLKEDNLFCNIVLGKAIVMVYKKGIDFIISPLNNCFIKSKLEIKETTFNSDFISLNII